MQPAATDPDGTKIYSRPVPYGFILFVEARPGPNRRSVGTTTYNHSPGDPNVLPNLQIVVSEALGNGSSSVCDKGPAPNLGGVPAVDPPRFGGDQASANAINDLACRFDARGNSSDACTRNGLQDASFASTSTKVQFCPSVAIGAEIGFPPGDTRITARVTDAVGQPGLPASIIIRLEP